MEEQIAPPLLLLAKNHLLRIQLLLVLLLPPLMPPLLLPALLSLQVAVGYLRMDPTLPPPCEEHGQRAHQRCRSCR